MVKCPYYSLCLDFEHEKTLCTAVYLFCKQYKKFQIQELEELRKYRESKLELGAEMGVRKLDE